jgi:GNAT superfamily N-acetyltransferase
VVIDPTVRPGQPDDCDQLRQLEREARAAVAEHKGGLRWLDLHPARDVAWDQAIAGGTTYVAHIDEVVVGYLVTSRRVPIAYVDEVYVMPEARELGFGDTLIETAVAAAREAGCTSIEGEALPGDRETKNLYERAGITARLIVLARTIA